MPPFRVVIFTGTAIAGTALAAAGPNLHYNPKLECNHQAELCGLPEVAAPDDKPAPKRAPLMIFSQPVAGFTATATGTSLAAWLLELSRKPTPPAMALPNGLGCHEQALSMQALRPAWHSMTG
jgi:hypothetical protein